MSGVTNEFSISRGRPERAPRVSRRCPHVDRAASTELSRHFISEGVWGNSALWQPICWKPLSTRISPKQLKNPDAVSLPSLFRSKRSKLLLQKKFLEISFACVGLSTNSELMNENIFSHFRWSSKLLKILNKIAMLIYT